jgi:large subunit ribosomal protein L23
MVLKKPHITEKANSQQQKSVYTFVVDFHADKQKIKADVEKMFAVNVLSVNTMRYRGKFKSRFTKSGTAAGHRDQFKKAVVTLKEGEFIDIYGNTNE